MCNQELKKHKDNEVTDKINDLAIGAHNKKFKNTRTSMDWLCSNGEEIDKYMKDDKCKKEYTIGIFRELLNSMEFACNKKNIKLMNKNTPILLLSGEDDPVGKFGKGVKKIYDFFLSAGIKNVSMKLYPGLRHDIFHEKNNLEIFEDIYNWINK
jgi:alpha-beta hydrolase superfamily lysophospholipase